MNAIGETAYQFDKQTGFYRGKVRDVYFFGDKMVVVASDRISAFDVVLPRAIPYKGQVLNQIAARFLRATADIVPNWLREVPDPNVSVGIRCQPFAVEMVIRGYLAGHAWREYQAGKREVCGEPLPDGLKENDRLPAPIITPSTKAKAGHDEDITREEIIGRGLVGAEDYARLEGYTRALFARGTEMASARGLILVDTKYEFGKLDGALYLIDEIHTPDSSRYFHADGYEARQARGQPQRQLSKEFVREWLIRHGFQGQPGQTVPALSDEWVRTVSDRYVELYEQVTGTTFDKADNQAILRRIEQNILRVL
ncbi:MAG: phosphoribosylaminoimidazolesuccinocarboxamide synthase [Ferruginibacter sp.]|nr:phosphoribosylaminoimidazolesuccinocarboxamide synthase [Cytophagales bacterium]